MQLAAGFGGRLGQVARTGRSLVQGSGGSSAAGRDPAPYSSQLLRMRVPSPRVGPHNPGARCSHRQVASPSMVDSSRQLAPTCDHTRCDNWNKRMENGKEVGLRPPCDPGSSKWPPNQPPLCTEPAWHTAGAP